MEVLAFNIQSKIYTIRGVQVMLDRDIALLFQTETRVLKQGVRRNLDRFPEDFMFLLTDNDLDDMVSQLVIPSKQHFGGALPFAFTEQGVAMLTTIIKSPVAIKASIQIMQAFVKMRKFLVNNASVFLRLDHLEYKQLQTDEKIEQVFKALEAGQPKPDKGIFFNGQIFDAYVFVVELVKNAKSTILLIDNYVDETVLTLLNKRNKDVMATIYTKNISKALQLDLHKHNAQYPSISIEILEHSHDRFLIIDNMELYHIGASLKDLGKKWFAFSRMDSLLKEVLTKIEKNGYKGQDWKNNEGR